MSETKTGPTTKTLLAGVIDSALFREDVEQLLEALRLAEFWAEPAGADGVRLDRRRWEKVVERYDLLRQSFPLAKARASGAGR